VLALAMPPEGTRSLAPHWKSGFYHVASRAGVPIAMGYLDYARREGGIGAPLLPSGNLAADMERIRAFYADKTGRHPALQGPIRLASEEAKPAGTLGALFPSEVARVLVRGRVDEAAAQLDGRIAEGQRRAVDRQ
jgi:hypothetical protein